MININESLIEINIYDWNQYVNDLNQQIND